MSDLEQRIKEAAAKYEREEDDCEPLFHAADILALLAEKDAEIERLTAGVKGLREELKDVAAEARWAERQGEDYGSY